MQRPLLASFLWLVSSCGHPAANPSSSSSAAAADASAFLHFDRWQVDPSLGLGAKVEVTDSWVRIDDGGARLSAQIRWDLFPFSFESEVVSDTTDGCGHRHLVGHLAGTPQTSAYRTTDMDLTLFDLSEQNSLGCRAGHADAAVLVLKTESHEGFKTASTLSKGAAAAIPAAAYDCRAVRPIDQEESEAFEVLFTERLRFDEQAGIPVQIFVRSRWESLSALTPGPWSTLVDGEIARMTTPDQFRRTLAFPSGKMTLEPGNSGITGQLDSLQGTLELSTDSRKLSVDVFCVR